MALCLQREYPDGEMDKEQGYPAAKVQKIYTKYNKICFEYSDFKYNIACVFNTKKMTNALDQSALDQFLRLFRGWIMKYLSDLR